VGPLRGVTVIEIASIGPGPFCGMMLADLGAEVVRVDRADAVSGSPAGGSSYELLNRGKRSIGVDLKNPAGVEVVLTMVEQTDGLRVSAGGSGTAWHWPGRVPGTQSSPGVWASDRMGSTGAALGPGRP
jgi:hypothetical protein